MSPGPTHIYCFDFDGVIVNSANETGETAWRAAHGLWSERLPPLPTAAYRERIPRLRPVIETGFENVPLVRLFVDGVSDDEILGNFPALTAALIEREQLDRTDLRARFGAARDAWMREDMASWLAAQSFYDGVVEAINSLKETCCIITTKEDRFTRQLVARAGLDVAGDRIYALEAFEGAGKKGVLEALHEEFPAATLHFFEDRYRTLVKLHALDFVKKYLVDWGYNTPAERELARDDESIELLDRAGFERVLRG